MALRFLENLYTPGVWGYIKSTRYLRNRIWISVWCGIMYKFWVILLFADDTVRMRTGIWWGSRHYRKLKMLSCWTARPCNWMVTLTIGHMRCAVGWIPTFGGQFYCWRFQIPSYSDSLVPCWMDVTRDDIGNYSWTSPTLRIRISFNLDGEKACWHFASTCTPMLPALNSRLEAVPWRGLLVTDTSPRDPGTNVKLVVSKEVRGYDFLRIFRCTPVNIISPVLNTNSRIINTIQYQQFMAS